MRKIFVFALILALCAVFIKGECANASGIPIEEINPGFIYISPPGDGGWTFMQEK